MIHPLKRLNRRNQPRVDFLVVSVPSRASEEIHRSKRSTMSRGGGWIRFGEICLTDHRSYGVRQGAIAGYKVAGTVTYVYRAVRKPALRNERSAIGLLPCPLRSFISILLPAFLFFYSSACLSLYPSLSATQRYSFVANLRRDSQLEVIAMRACRIRISFAHRHGGPPPSIL